MISHGMMFCHERNDVCKLVLLIRINWIVDWLLSINMIAVQDNEKDKRKQIT